MSWSNIGSLGKGISISKYRKDLENLPNWFKEFIRKYLENHKNDGEFLAGVKKIGVILSRNGYKVSVTSMEELDIIKEWAEV